MTENLSRQIEDQPAAPPANVCDRCGYGVHQTTDPAPAEGDAKWYHDSIADDIFCGIVMRAADRRAAR